MSDKITIKGARVDVEILPQAASIEFAKIKVSAIFDEVVIQGFESPGMASLDKKTQELIRRAKAVIHLYGMDGAEDAIKNNKTASDKLREEIRELTKMVLWPTAREAAKPDDQ